MPAAPNTPETDLDASRPRRPSQYQLAAGVAKHVELRNVVMRSVSAAVKLPLAEACSVIEAGKTDANVKVKPTHTFDEGSLSLTVAIEFEISITTGDPPRDVLELGAVFELSYGVDSPPPPEHRDVLLNAFAHLNGTYNAWPYVRELVQSTTARMALPPVVLPVFRVGPETQKTTEREPDSRAEPASTQD